jgi:hypothetical protein
VAALLTCHFLPAKSLPQGIDKVLQVLTQVKPGRLPSIGKETCKDKASKPS